MKVIEFEKKIIENEYTDEEFLKLIKSIKTNIDFYSEDSKRKLSEEEIDYEFFDDFIVDILENLNLDDNALNEMEDNSDKIIESNMYLVYRLALYFLREGIHYEDLTQEGIIGLIKACNILKKVDDFNNYKELFIVREFINHTERYCDYRRTAFKKYAETEKNNIKEKDISLNIKDELKQEEYERLKKENELKNLVEMNRLEKLSEAKFNYFNLPHRLSYKEIKVLEFYFGLKDRKKRNFTEIMREMKLENNDLDSILKSSIYKISVTEEKVEL